MLLFWEQTWSRGAWEGCYIYYPHFINQESTGMPKNIALQRIELVTNPILIDQAIEWEEQAVFLKYNSGFRGEFSAKSEHVLSCSPSPGAKVNNQNR